MRDIDWKVRFDQNRYSPGSTARLNFIYENRNRYHHYISQVLIQPSWADRFFWNVNEITVNPMNEEYLPPLELNIPEGLGGEQSLRFGVGVIGHNQYTDNRVEYRKSWAEYPFALNLDYKKYTAFVSRSNDPGDVDISDAIQNKIRDWGFQTKTLFSGVDDSVRQIVADSQTADCLFGIAVPRYETVEGESPQFHYLDSEAGMALVQEIPVVIFEHESVDLKGIPKECLRVQFCDPSSVEFQVGLTEIMLLVRRTIKNNKMAEFRGKVIKIGTALGVGALIGANLGQTVDDDQNQTHE